jgi:hypothetical protein
MCTDARRAMGSLPILAALALLCALWGAVPAQADPGPVWTAPLATSPLGDYTQGAADAAANARGDELIAWSVGPRELYFVRRSAGGSFGDPVRLDGFGNSVRVAMNAEGDALIMWRDGLRGAEGEIVPADSDALIPIDVSTGSEYSTAMYSEGGIADDGTVTVFWTDTNHIWYSRRSAGGSFAAPKAVPNPGAAANGLDAKVAPDGSAALTWGSGFTEYVSSSSAHSGFTTTALSSADDPSALDYDPLLGVAGGGLVALNASGDAVVAWLQGNRNYREYDVLASTRAGADRTFGAPQTIQAESPLGGGPTVGIDPQGRATMSWTGSAVPPGSPNNNLKLGVWDASSSDDGVFSPPELLTLQHGCYTAVAATPDGTVYVVWSEYDGPHDSGCSGAVPSEFAAVRSPGAEAFSDATPLVSGSVMSGPPQVAASGESGALAAWVRGTLAPDYQLQVEYASTDGKLATSGGGAPPDDADPPADGAEPPVTGPVTEPPALEQPPVQVPAAPRSESRPLPSTARIASLRVGAPVARRGDRLSVNLTCRAAADCRARVALYASGRRLATRGPYTVSPGHRRRVTLSVGARVLKALERGVLRLKPAA